ncbi:hypothetical protein INR49_005177 [Caranx melampygus]|nr:hypothetical protein INR49_005177 [Caranx melampygus]
MILNGVCVIWRGWIDLQRLDGMGYLEYDEERAQHEDALAQAAFEEARRRTRDFEDRDRSHREDLEVREDFTLIQRYLKHNGTVAGPCSSNCFLPRLISALQSQTRLKRLPWRAPRAVKLKSFVSLQACCASDHNYYD